MNARSRRGESLVELIVALLLLELAGAAALTAALTCERLGRRAAQGAADDLARWESYRSAELATGCVEASVPTLSPFLLPETATRPAFVTSLRCGR